MRESEERHRLLVELHPDAILVIEDEKVVFANPAAAVLLGRQVPEELIGCSHLDYVQRDFHTVVRQRWHQVIATGMQAPALEQKWLLPDGGTVTVEVTVHRFPQRATDEVGNALGQQLQISARDVTQQRLSEERFRVAVEAAPNGMVMVSEGGLIVLANTQMKKMFGYDEVDLVGQPIELLVPERFRDQHPIFRARFFRSPETRGMGMGRELFGCRRDGSEFPVEIGLNPIRMEQGHFVLASIIDVTERKRAEDSLRHWNATLEQRVAERTAAVEEANRAKSRFLANMSHEIRTPMNGILGLADLVLDTELSDKQRDCVTSISGCAEALLRVIDDILDFSKIEAGKLDLAPAPFRLRGSLDDLLKPLALSAEQKGLALTCQVEPAVPDALFGDLGRLRQVIVNLVGNAIKFTAQGQVAVHVRVEDQAEGQLCLAIAVADTGIGIPPDRQAAIFAPFEQGDNSMSRHYGGTGLGLTISARLVELMGGRIWLKSKVGQGSTFHCTAWLVVPDSLDVGRPESETPVQEGTGPRFRAPCASSWPRTTRSTRRWPWQRCRRVGIRSSWPATGVQLSPPWSATGSTWS